MRARSSAHPGAPIQASAAAAKRERWFPFAATADLDPATFDVTFAVNVRVGPSGVRVIAFVALPRASDVPGAIIAADGGRTAV